MRALALLSLLLCDALLAAEPRTQSQADLSDSFQGFSGNASLNQAAGDGHQQANVRVVTMGDQPAAPLRIEQRQGALVAPAGLDASARIQGQSFSQANGISGVNQSAGIGNQNINAFHMVVGTVPESLEDAVLSQSTATSAVPAGGTPADGKRVVETSDQAFAGSRGVVQLNQSAGVGNRTANSLSIRVVDRP
jgi:hypothetical protein